MCVCPRSEGQGRWSGMGISVPFAKSARSRFPLIAMRHPVPLGVRGVARYRAMRVRLSAAYQ